MIEALCKAGFTVQALTRRSVSDTVKPALSGVMVFEVDYSNQDELRSVLTGQDAVLSALGDTAGAVAAQKALIEASIATGVKRFIPSEFGSDTMHPRVRSFPFFADKLKHQDLLKDAAAEHPTFSYSTLITGPFLDWGLAVVPFIINVGSRSAQGTYHMRLIESYDELTKEVVYDGGDVPFSTTRVSTLAKAVVATLQKPEETKNRTLYIHDAIITQNQLIARSQTLSGEIPFTRSEVSTKALEKEAWSMYGDPTADPLSWIFSFINISIWSGEELCVFRSTDNDLLGIQEFEGPELCEVLDEEISKAMRVFAGTNTSAASGTDYIDSKTADKAFEDGKRKLVGYCPST